MKPLEEARSEVLSSVGLLGVEQVPIWQGHGRVLATDVVAPENVPPFANSAMDGFAVRAADVSAAGSVLEVIGDLPAGSSTDIEVRAGPGDQDHDGRPNATRGRHRRQGRGHVDRRLEGHHLHGGGAGYVGPPGRWRRPREASWCSPQGRVSPRCTSVFSPPSESGTRRCSKGPGLRSCRPVTS